MFTKRVDFREIDAPSFNTKKDDDKEDVESEADQLIKMVENSTVLKSIALNIGEKGNSWGFTWQQATDLVKKDIKCLKKLLIAKEGQND